MRSKSQRGKVGRVEESNDQDGKEQELNSSYKKTAHRKRTVVAAFHSFYSACCNDLVSI